MYLKTTQPTTKLIEYSRLFDTRGCKSYLTFDSVQCTKPKFSQQVTVNRFIVEIEVENVFKIQLLIRDKGNQSLFQVIQCFASHFGLNKKIYQSSLFIRSMRVTDLAMNDTYNLFVTSKNQPIHKFKVQQKSQRVF